MHNKLNTTLKRFLSSWFVSLWLINMGFVLAYFFFDYDLNGSFLGVQGRVLLFCPLIVGAVVSLVNILMYNKSQ